MCYFYPRCLILFSILLIGQHLMKGACGLWVSLMFLSLVHLSLKSLEHFPHLLTPESHKKLQINHFSSSTEKK